VVPISVVATCTTLCGFIPYYSLEGYDRHALRSQIGLCCFTTEDASPPTDILSHAHSFHSSFATGRRDRSNGTATGAGNTVRRKRRLSQAAGGDVLRRGCRCCHRCASPSLCGQPDRPAQQRPWGYGPRAV